MHFLFETTNGLKLLIQIHTFTAIVLTVLAIPLTILMKKGSIYHRACGITSLLLAVIFSGSAILMLFNPFIVPHLKADIPRYQIDTAYVYNTHPDLLLLGLISIFCYAIFSAYRIWPRTKHSKDDRITSSLFDWLLTLVAAWVAIFYFQVFLYDIGHHPSYANIFLVPSAIMLIFAAFDVYTFTFRPHISGRPWWALHMSKMLLAWITMIKGFLFRDFHLSLNKTVFHEVMSTIVWIVVCLIIYLIFRKRFSQLSKQGSTKNKP
ncbi:hypothetical protein [Microbulbifer sp. THAF38]|uniref:hypothetical protein n=1 Tax=Microbulbifer sp. THAF38 TaxID=2587856 RepID=UPI0012679B22|nr:hypothetical protein [Microbulbifer sp. THAF38]QFT54017.1 hypothetical protein FIU95_05480 [Microbulbifer sp. THAF38]